LCCDACGRAHTLSAAHRGVASSATLGWLASLSVVLSSVFALPFTALVARIGNARSGLVAALCVGGGYVLLSYALHALPLLFAAQALVGVGYGLMFAACSSLATQYFVRRRGLAGGIVYAGSGVGGAVLAVGLSRLARAVGLAWAIRIYGLLALAVLVPASWLLKHRVPPPLAMVRMCVAPCVGCTSRSSPLQVVPAADQLPPAARCHGDRHLLALRAAVLPAHVCRVCRLHGRDGRVACSR
jgi:MFS family permease